MAWVLAEIVVPLVLAAGLGLAVGWLLWRWRRDTVTVSEWEYESDEVAPTHVGATKPIAANGTVPHSGGAEETAETTRLRDERDGAIAHVAVAEEKLQRSTLRLKNLEEELAAKEQWSRQIEADFLRAKSRVAELETALDRHPD